MKRLIALAMSLLMVGTIAAAPVYAEETEGALVEINWSDAEAAAEKSGVEASFYTFDEVAMMLWIPDVLVNTELTEEDVEAGYIGYFQTEDESAAVSVMYVDTDGMTLEDYAAFLEENGAAEIEPGILNGLPALSYSIPESDTTAIAFTTEQGYVLEVAFAPMSDEDFAATAALITASIQPYEAEEETEAQAS